MDLAQSPSLERRGGAAKAATATEQRAPAETEEHGDDGGGGDHVVQRCLCTASPGSATHGEPVSPVGHDTINGLDKTECAYGPDTTGWDDFDELELATLFASLSPPVEHGSIGLGGRHRLQVARRPDRFDLGGDRAEGTRPQLRRIRLPSAVAFRLPSGSTIDLTSARAVGPSGSPE